MTTTLPANPSIQQVSEFLGISTRTTRRMIAAGDLKARRITKRLIRIDRESVLALVAS